MIEQKVIIIGGSPIGIACALECKKRIEISFSEDEKQLPTYNPDTIETNVENLYLEAVICGGNETHKWFIENSRIQAKIIANNIENSKL